MTPDFSELLAAIIAAADERERVKVDVFFAVLASDPSQSIQEILEDAAKHMRAYDEGWYR